MNEYLSQLLVSGNAITDDEAKRLAEWANAQSLELSTVFIQMGIFRDTAVRTIELIRKGFVTAPDAGMLFTPTGRELLRNLTQSPAKIGSTQTLGHNSTLAGQAVAAIPATRTIESSEADRVAERTTRAIIDPGSSIELQPKRSYAAAGPLPATDQILIAPASPRHSYSNANVRQQAPAAPAEPTVGTMLGKCMLTGLLGKGGRGMVFSALHKTLNLPVAIKVLRADDQRNTEERYRELQHEARLLAQLNHQNVVRVLDFDNEPYPYVVMELVEGPNLADLITQTGGLRVERAAEIILQAAMGLAAAWNLKIVHRDIKPANLLLSRDGGGVKVADLGLAIHSNPDQAGDTSWMPLGTCAYMAPEQAISAATVDFRADIYSLGATFYHAVTGQMPFTAKNSREMLFKHAAEPLIPAHVIAPGIIDPDVSELIDTMMAKQPDDRFSSYDALTEELKQLVCRPPQYQRPDTQVPHGRTTARSSGIFSWLLRKNGASDPDTQH